VHSLALSIVVAAETAANDKKDLYPKLSELVVAALGFAIVFFFMWKWVLPRVNQILEARRQKIQGDLERAEQTRSEADLLLDDYRERLSGVREESNRIIEEARQTAESMRRDMQKRAEDEAAAIIARAQEEIRGERDRVFEELKSQVGELSLQLAGRMVGESLDSERQLRLVDQYIRELGAAPGAGNGNGRGPAGGTEG